MNYHLIIGYGYWSKKNLNYLSNKKIFDSIIIKARKNYFFFNNGSIIKKKQIEEINKKISSVHICTPIKSHFSHLKKFNSFKKTVIEKPFLEKINEVNEIKKIYKNKFLIVNYIDIFNPLINKIKRSIKNKKFYEIALNYSKKDKYYRNKKESVLEWLDHPLSLTLFFFKKFPKLKIETNELQKKNKLYNRRLVINYFFKNFTLKIKINCSKNIERNLQIFRNKNIETYHFYKNSFFRNKNKIFQSKKSSFDNFYNFLIKGRKHSAQNFDFHKKIILERNKILKKLDNL